MGLASPSVQEPAGGTESLGSWWFEAAALITLVLATVHGFRGALDLHAWDEAIYFRQGLDLWNGQIDGYFFAWGPGLSTAYAVLCKLPLGSWHPCDAMLLCVTTGSTLALWWAFRAILPPAAAVVIAAWWGAGLPDIMPLGTMLQTSIYLFVATLQFFALGCVARGRIGVALAALAYGGMTRPEVGFFLVLFSTFATWIYRRQRETQRARISFAGVLIGLAITAMHLTLPDARERSWLVFRQHYAMGVEERRDPTDIAAAAMAHADPNPYIEAGFGTAQSIHQAAIANPGELAEHMFANLGEVTQSLGQLCISAFSHTPWERNVLLAAILILIALGVLRGRATQPNLNPQQASAVWLFLLVGLIAIPISMLVRPRRELLIAAMPLIYTIAGRAAVAGANQLIRSRLHSTALAVVVPTLVIALALVTPRRFDELATRIHEQRTSMVMLNRNPIPSGSRLLGYNAVNVLKYTDLEGVTPLNLHRLCLYSHSPHKTVRETVETTDPDFFLVTSTPLQLEAISTQIIEEISRDEWILEDLSPVSMLFRRSK